MGFLLNNRTMEKELLIHTVVLQDTVYLQKTEEAVKNLLKSYYVFDGYTTEELKDALMKALDVLSDEDNWADEYAKFSQGTRYNRGEICENKYGHNRYYPLTWWAKRKIRKAMKEAIAKGETDYDFCGELPEYYPLYWLFLIVPAYHWYDAKRLEDYKITMLEAIGE